MRYWALAMACAVGCGLTTAEAGTVNVRATGVQVMIQQGGVIEATVTLQVTQSDVHDSYDLAATVEHWRGPSLLGVYDFAAIHFGHASDGTNCNSGGATCSGNCRMQINGIDTPGGCVEDTVKAPNGEVICLCQAGKNKSTLFSATVQPGDTFVGRLDPQNLVQESDETDNVKTLTLGQ
jgi:hypothetical protein